MHSHYFNSHLIRIFVLKDKRIAKPPEEKEP
ncbi:MAG: hypothetical protein ACD_38C00110G0004, partial [uncultured bacterium]